MFKQIICVITLSIILIFTMPYAQQGLQALLSVHDWVADALKNVFTGSQVGSVIRELLALLAAPFAVGLVPGVFYWVVKRSWFPYFMELVWAVWLVQTSALIILYQTLR